MAYAVTNMTTKTQRHRHLYSLSVTWFDTLMHVTGKCSSNKKMEKLVVSNDKYFTYLINYQVYCVMTNKTKYFLNL